MRHDYNSLVIHYMLGLDKSTEPKLDTRGPPSGATKCVVTALKSEGVLLLFNSTVLRFIIHSPSYFGIYFMVMGALPFQERYT